MKSKIIISCFIFLFFVSSKCNNDNDNYHYDLTIKNNSLSIISVSPNFTYPDTTIICPLGHYEISSGEEHIDHQRYGWEPSIGYLKYFQIFIIDPDIINSTPCDSIKKYHIEWNCVNRRSKNLSRRNRSNLKTRNLRKVISDIYNPEDEVARSYQ